MKARFSPSEPPPWITFRADLTSASVRTAACFGGDVTLKLEVGDASRSRSNRGNQSGNCDDGFHCVGSFLRVRLPGVFGFGVLLAVFAADD